MASDVPDSYVCMIMKVIANVKFMDINRGTKKMIEKKDCQEM